MNQALVIGGMVVYCLVVAAFFNWLFRNVWFATFLSVVASEVLLFGGAYLYYGYWDAWWDIAVITFGAIAIGCALFMGTVFYWQRKKKGASNAPT